LLNLGRTLHGIYYADKLGQQIIAGRVDYSATMLADQDTHYLAIGSEQADGGHLVGAHEAAVAFDIGAQDGCQFTLNTLWVCTWHLFFLL
jgi:hypothetical protein